MDINKVTLLVIDTLRFDCNGYQPEKHYLERDDVLQFLDTPTLNEISNESVCFTKCYSTSSVTTPVIANMFTGTIPANHGIYLLTNTNIQTEYDLVISDA